VSPAAVSCSAVLIMEEDPSFYVACTQHPTTMKMGEVQTIASNARTRPSRAAMLTERLGKRTLSTTCTAQRNTAKKNKYAPAEQPATTGPIFAPLPMRSFDGYLSMPMGHMAVSPRQSMQARTTRDVFKELVATLDQVLPDEFRSCPRPNGAGSRSLGGGGRSVHDVFADVVRAVAARRAELDRLAILRSCGPVTVEVEMPGWTITSLSPGAELFFKDAPWGSVVGQSLADFVQWEDLDLFNSLCRPHDALLDYPLCCELQTLSQSSADSAHESATRCIKLMHFQDPGHTQRPLPSRRLPSPAACAQSQASSTECPNTCGREEANLLLRLPSASEHGCVAFIHDPLLCEHSLLDTAEQSVTVIGEYVAMRVQVLEIDLVSSARELESPRTLVSLTWP